MKTVYCQLASTKIKPFIYSKIEKLPLKDYLFLSILDAYSNLFKKFSTSNSNLVALKRAVFSVLDAGNDFNL